MLKKTITYTDFDGNKRTEDFYFNLTQQEIVELQFSQAGGFEATIQRIIMEQDYMKIMSMFKEMVLAAYGVRSTDGKGRFIKNDTIREEFMSTQAYSDIYMELASDDRKAAEFIRGIMPEELKKDMPSVDVMMKDAGDKLRESGMVLPEVAQNANSDNSSN